MSRIAYVNGRYVPHRSAQVHVEDRGYQFADGIYEVVAVRHGHLVDELPHLDRLDRSLGEMRMAAPMGRAPLRHAMRGSCSSASIWKPSCCASAATSAARRTSSGWSAARCTGS